MMLGAHLLVGSAIVVMSMALLPACESTALPPAQRTYDRISAQELYTLMEGVFSEAGFVIFQRDRLRGFLQTYWKESDLDTNGAPARQERRMYAAWLNADYDRLRVYLTLNVEEKARTDSSWKSKAVVREQDPEFAALLQALDRAVQRRDVGPTRRGRDQHQP